jgi:hypothetical protein
MLYTYLLWNSVLKKKRTFRCDGSSFNAWLPSPEAGTTLGELACHSSFCCLQSPAWWKSGFVIIAPYLLLARWALKTLDFLTSHFSHFFSTLTNITLVIRPIPPLLSLAHSINHHHIHHCFHPTICFSICIVFCIQVEGSSFTQRFCHYPAILFQHNSDVLDQPLSFITFIKKSRNSIHLNSRLDHSASEMSHLA